MTDSNISFPKIWEAIEGASFYFLDPDGHKLEVHVGDLQSRLATCRHKPYPGMRFCDEP